MRFREPKRAGLHPIKPFHMHLFNQDGVLELCCLIQAASVART
jgi:hypothetical protein